MQVSKKQTLQRQHPLQLIVKSDELWLHCLNRKDKLTLAK